MQIHLHASLRRYCDNQASIELVGSVSFPQLLANLVQEYPALEPILFNQHQELNPYILIYVNGQDARYLAPDFIIPEQAKIDIMTSLVGG